MSSSVSRRPIATVVAVAAVLALLTVAADAQYFGRNKVLWEDFDFHVLETEHFSIYYYPEQSEAIEDAARMAERWYDRLSRAFGYEFRHKRPIILYANHADFQQTTVTGGLISEGTGGFTEPYRSRVVLPLTGTYEDTDHVVGHELVHAFQFAIAEELSRGPGSGAALSRLPLWMVEGIAEYLSVGPVDPHTAMWLRDAVIHDDLPTFRKLADPRYFPYRFGHAFWAYVAGEYGDRRATRMFVAALAMGIRPAIEESLGIEPDALIAAWHSSIRDQYGPILAAERPDREPGRLLGDPEEGRDLHLGPALSPSGDQLAFLGSRDLFAIGLYVADAVTGEVREQLVNTSDNRHFDALRFIDAAGAWSPDGRTLALVAFARGDNTIVIADGRSGDIERRLDVSGLGAIADPAWSPDGRSLVLSGTQKGISDLYVVDVADGGTRQLTDDRYTNLQPSWSPDGRTIAFVTDQGPGTDLDDLVFGPLRLALFDTGTGEVQILEPFRGAKHVNPKFSPDGRDLYFVSDPDGVSNVYRYALDTGEMFQVTDVATGVSGITDLSPALSVASETGRIAYTVFENRQYNVYTLEPEEARGTPVTGLATERRGAKLPPGDERQEQLVEAYLEQPRFGLPEIEEMVAAEYQPRLGLEFIGGAAVGLSSDAYGYGLGGGLTALFSDMLGRHQLGVSFQGGARTDDLGTSFGAEGVYINRTDRFNWGVTASHVPYISGQSQVLRGVPIDVGDGVVTGDLVQQLRQEVLVDEVGLIGQYPLSLTRRVEAQTSYNFISYDTVLEEWAYVDGRFIGRRTDDSLPAPPDVDYGFASAAYVGDSSFFGFTSPLRGSRYRFEVGQTFGDFSYQTALADYRRYWFANPVSFAIRGLHYGRYGGDDDSVQLRPLFVGDQLLVRGYEVDSFEPEECSEIVGSSGCPEFDRMLGTRLGVVKAELRLQALGTEELGLVSMPYLPTELVAFVDAGVAWTEDEDPELKFEEDSIERIPVVSAGIAARILLGGYIPIEVYYAYPFQRPEESGVFGFFIAPGW